MTPPGNTVRKVPHQDCTMETRIDDLEERQADDASTMECVSKKLDAAIGDIGEIKVSMARLEGNVNVLCSVIAPPPQKDSKDGKAVTVVKPRSRVVDGAISKVWLAVAAAIAALATALATAITIHFSSPTTAATPAAQIPATTAQPAAIPSQPAAPAASQVAGKP